jgi:hypothetical protein
MQNAREPGRKVERGALRFKKSLQVSAGKPGNLPGAAVSRLFGGRRRICDELPAFFSHFYLL